MDQLTPTHRPGRPAGRLRGAAAAVITVALLSAAAACGSDDDDSSSSPSGGAGTDNDAEVLGTENAASGEPIKVGFVSDGRTATIDNTAHGQAADAMAEYLNDYEAGLAGRPIELVECEAQGEPGKATDCANQLVQAEVAVVVMPESQAAASVHTVTKENKIPLFVYGVADTSILADGETAFALVDVFAGLSDLPIGVAEDEGIEQVTAVVIDVPAATAFFEVLAPDIFDEAGIDLELVTVPPTQADMTPQMTEIASGDETVVHIIGNDSFCIAAMNGLESAAYDGPITILNGCGNEATATGVGDYMDGVVMAAPFALGDDSEPGIQLWNAIADTYGEDIDDPDDGLTTFITFMAMRLALEDLQGDVTTETIISTVQAMESTPIPGSAGLEFRCNGKAAPLLPAICTRGSLRVTLDADGQPMLPYELAGSTPIED